MASSTVARASTSVAAFQKVEVGNAATKASRAFAAVPVSSKRGQSLMVRASAKEEAAVPRRAMLSLLAAAAVSVGAVQKANADATSITIGPSPKPFGGLPGTKNADEARDLDQPLKQRFFLQSEDVAGAQARLKASAAAIQDSEKYIAKKAWPYVQNQLRLEAQYLNFDIDTIASSKSKEEKKAIKALQKSLNAELDSLDYAARKKSQEKAKESYDKVVSLLNDVISKA
jgi:photosystem II oxygen-evolving enhancer protein 3